MRRILEASIRRVSTGKIEMKLFDCPFYPGLNRFYINIDKATQDPSTKTAQYIFVPMNRVMTEKAYFWQVDENIAIGNILRIKGSTQSTVFAVVCELNDSKIEFIECSSLIDALSKMKKILRTKK